MILDDCKLQIKTSCKSNISSYHHITQLINAQNDCDKATFFKDKDSQCLQNHVNFSFIIALRGKQDKNPTVTLNIFMRREGSLFSANDTSTLLRKKYGGEEISVDSVLWIISFHIILQEWIGVRWNSLVYFDFPYQYQPWMCWQPA